MTSRPSQWARERVSRAGYIGEVEGLAVVFDKVRAEVIEEAAREADHLSEGHGVGLGAEIAARIRELTRREGGAT